MPTDLPMRSIFLMMSYCRSQSISATCGEFWCLWLCVDGLVDWKNKPTRHGFPQIQMHGSGYRGWRRHATHHQLLVALVAAEEEGVVNDLDVRQEGLFSCRCLKRETEGNVCVSHVM
jgi:hypothetical protein